MSYRSVAVFSALLFFLVVVLVAIQGVALAQSSGWPEIILTPVQGELAAPVHVTNAGDGGNRLFIVEQEGRIRIRKNGALLATPFLDISGPGGRVSCCGERGFLSIAFPPGYATKQHFYVYYTNLSGDIVIARYRVTTNPDIADPNSEEILLTIPHATHGNHNGGQLAFGPNDGYLYIGPGDGGGGGDPSNNGQNPLSLLGKLLRIDVESRATPYAVPPTNPFVGNANYRPETWALGVRNPWRFTFDRQTGDLYIGDVGQGSYEEIDFQPASSLGGENYGWRCKEGIHDYNFSGSCGSLLLTPPVVEYPHSGPPCTSVTGGAVYRGRQYRNLTGIYFYGDYCTGQLWGLKFENGAWLTQELLNSDLNISSFGEDEQGELYVADLGGVIYKIASTPPAADIDLTGSWAIVRRTCRTTFAGLRCIVSGRLLLHNQGADHVRLPSLTKFYLSTDATLSADDVELRQRPTGRVRASGTRNLTVRMALPLGSTVLDRYVLAVVDAGDTIVETEESNNVIVFGPVQ